MTTPKIRFSLEGQPLDGEPGDTLAAALLRNGVTTFTRSIKYHRPRGPFCFSGSCGQCLVRVDGVPSLPACRVPLAEGMRCERQNAPMGLIESDLFRAVDFVYPGGLDHHHLMIQSRLLGKVALEVARRLAGLGTLPDRIEHAKPGEVRAVPLVIIGAGPAGLAAAQGALEAGVHGLRPLLLERDNATGGAARLFHDNANDWHGNKNDWHANQVDLLTDAEVVGLYADAHAGAQALLAVRRGDKLLAVRANRVIVATGGTPQPLPFPGVDRPGVYAARGLIALQRRSGLRVGEDKPIAIAGSGRELARCAMALHQAGYAIAVIVALDDQAQEEIAKLALPAEIERLRGELTRARGRPVAEAQVRLASGETKKIRCGALALALPAAPLYDLASSAGAKNGFSAAHGGFPIEIDESGRSSVRWLFACGTVAGRGLLDEMIGAANVADNVNDSPALALARRGGLQAAREAAALAAAEGKSGPETSLA